MRIPEQYKCDVEGCDQVKGPTNGWWLVGIHMDAQVWIMPWCSQGCPEKPMWTHVCGQEHAIQKASELMGKLKHD